MVLIRVCVGLSEAVAYPCFYHIGKRISLYLRVHRLCITSSLALYKLSFRESYGHIVTMSISLSKRSRALSVIMSGSHVGTVVNLRCAQHMYNRV